MNNSNACLPANSVVASERIATALDQKPGNISVELHESEIPDFVEAELERLYGNLFSSLPHLRNYGKLTQDTSTYIVRDGEVIVTIFLFRRRNRHLQVINEGMKIDGEEFRLFSNFIFDRYKSVKFISFNSIEAQVEKIPFPHQMSNCPCDIVLNLPSTQQEYLAILGKHTRYNTRRDMARLSADFPSFRMEFHEGAAIDESHLLSIISLNKARMDRLNNVYARDPDEVQRIINLAKAYGLVGVATIDGSVCAGSIGYHVGNTHTGNIISHDAKYDRYSIGKLCLYLVVIECIARGYQKFNFMSGNNEYKSLFGGKPRNLQQLYIYRSRMQLMLNPDVAVKVVFGRLVHRARLRVQMKLSKLKKAKTLGTLDAKSKAILHILDNLRILKDKLSIFKIRK